MLFDHISPDYFGHPQRCDRVALICGSSYASPLNVVLLRNHVEAVFAAVGERPGWTLRLHGGQPPFTNPAEAPKGIIEVWLEHADGRPLMFCVDFGGKYLTDDADLMSKSSEDLLQAFEIGARNVDPNVSLSLPNFDTMWLFLCHLAERLRVSKLTMSFGM